MIGCAPAAVNSSTVLYLPLNGTNGATTFYDLATGKVVTTNGDAKANTSSYMFGGSSLLLDGTGDSLSLLDSTDWYLNGDFTVGGWVNFAGNYDGDIIGQFDGTTEYWSLHRYSGNLVFRVRNGATTTNWLSYGWTPTTNQWYYISVVKSGNGAKLYINGSEVNSNAAVSPTMANVAGTLRIGGVSYAGNFNGRLDDWYIEKGCALTGTAMPTIEFGSNPAITVSSNVTSGVTSVPVQFNSTGTGDGTLTYFWQFGDGTTSTDRNATHTFTQTSTTNCTVTGTFGSAISSEIVITVYNPPIASFTENKTIGEIPLAIQFNDTSLNIPSSWNWQFGDGTENGTTQNPVHTFSAVGTYIVNLTVANAYGTSLSTNTTITTLPINTLGKNWSRFTDHAPMKARWGGDSDVMPNGHILMAGGDYDGASGTAEVWDFDGNNFSLMTASAEWGAKHGGSLNVFKGNPVYFGGLDAGFHSDIWKSTNNGTNWTQTNSGIIAGGLYRSTNLQDGNSYWIISGRNGATYKSSVYNTTDLITVNTIAASTAMPGRMGAGGFIDNTTRYGYILGGINDTIAFNDIWRFPLNDSGTFTQISSNIGFQLGYCPEPVVSGDKVFAMTGSAFGEPAGGNNHKIIYAYLSDLTRWYETMPSTPYFPPKGESSVVATPDGTIWVIGGYDDYTYTVWPENEIWKTTTTVPTWLDGWGKRQSVTINSTVNYYSVPIPFTVHTGIGNSVDHDIYLNNSANANLSDIRFTDSAMNLLDYNYRTINETTYNFMVELGQTPTTQTLYCYYNNTNAIPYTNGTNTYSLYDGFDAATVNLSMWDNGLTVISNSNLILQQTTGDHYITSKQYFPINSTTEMYGNLPQGATATGKDSIFYLLNAADTMTSGIWSSTTANQTTTRTSIAASITAVDRGSFTGNPQLYKIKRLSTTATNFSIDSSEWQHTANIYSSSIYGDAKVRLYARYTGGTGNNLTADWIAVMNSINPMPSYGAWTAEENVGVVTPVASFTANRTYVLFPGWIALTDTSSNTPTSWEWSMGDGSANITTQNVTYQYLKRGRWTVTEGATNSAGTTYNTTVITVAGG